MEIFRSKCLSLQGNGKQRILLVLLNILLIYLHIPWKYFLSMYNPKTFFYMNRFNFAAINFN